MSTLEDIVVRPGDELAFATCDHPHRLLIVSNRDGLLYFQELESSIGLISGKEMDRRLVQGDRKLPEGTVQLCILGSKTSLRFSTPESYEKTGVYLDIIDAKFDITGGTRIIGGYHRK